jgi:hypothetical protein
MQLSMDEFQKKLEQSEAWLLQSSSQMQKTLAQLCILKEDKETQGPRSLPAEDHLGGTEELAGRSVAPTAPSWAN